MHESWIAQLAAALAGAVVGALATFYFTHSLQRSAQLLDAYAAFAGAIEELVEALGPLVFTAEPEWLSIEKIVRLRVQEAIARTRAAFKKVQLLERHRKRYEALIACGNAIYDGTAPLSTLSDGDKVHLARGARPDRTKLAQIRSRQEELVRMVRRDFSGHLLEDRVRRFLSDRPTDEAVENDERWEREHLGK